MPTTAEQSTQNAGSDARDPYSQDERRLSHERRVARQQANANQPFQAAPVPQQNPTTRNNTRPNNQRSFRCTIS